MRKLYTTIILTLCCIICGTHKAEAKKTLEKFDIRIVNIEYVKVSPDKLKINMTLHTDVESLGRNEAVIVTPVISNGKEHEYLPQLHFDGKAKYQQYRRKVKFEAELPDIYSVTHIKTGSSTVNYTATVPHEEWMEGSPVYFEKTMVGCARKTGDLGTMLAGRIPEPYTAKPIPNRIEYVIEETQQNLSETHKLNFRQGHYEITATLGDNQQEIRNISEIIGKIQRDDQIVIDELHIIGYTSPEGGVAYNQRLAENRANAMRDYLISRYDLPASIIKVEAYGEDWMGLRTMVEASSLPDKDQVLKIIDSREELDAKEQRLKTLSSSYMTIYNDMYPKLRRTDCLISYTINDRNMLPVEELREKDPTTLSQRELFVLAQSYEAGSPKRQELYELILHMYPEDITDIVNLSATMLERDNLSEAKRYIDMAGDDPLIYNNIGVYYLMTGDIDKAENMFKKAKADGVEEAVHNLEEVNKKRNSL